MVSFKQFLKENAEYFENEVKSSLGETIIHVNNDNEVVVEDTVTVDETDADDFDMFFEDDDE